MSKNYFVFATFIFLLGCNSSGQIGISQNAPQSVSQPAPGKAVENSSDSVSSSPNPATIFFEQVRLRDGMSPIINGVGFLSRNAKVDEPFVLDLPNELEISPTLSVTAVMGGAIFADLTENSTNLELVNTETLQQASLLDVTGAISFTSSRDAKTVAWVTAGGSAFVARAPYAQKIQLDLGGVKARKILIAGSNPILYVLSENQTQSQVQIYAYPSPELGRSLTADNIAISPSGNEILLINGQKLQVYNNVNQTTSEIAGTFDVNEPDWLDEQTVSFWSKNSDGSGVLQALNILTGALSPITALNSNVLSAGISCPKWSGGELFFADYRNSEYSVFKATQSSGSWQILPFTHPSDSVFGYICPSPESLQ